MSKLSTKLSAGFIAIAVIASLIPGCGKTQEPEKSSVTAAITSETEEKPELRVLGLWMKDDYNTYPVAKTLEEKTGYHVVYEMLPQDRPEDKLNLIIASGDPYDLVTTVGGAANQALYSDYAKKGALMEVTPLMEKYGPNLKAAVSQQSFDSLKVDGKIYSIPTKAIEFVGYSMVVRQDWLDKLGMKVPTTLDEFTDMLKAFKQQDPGGNGADKNIGLTISGGVPMVESIRGAFGLTNDWNDIDGKLVNNVMNPAFKDYIVYMTDLYNQGLLDKEFGTNKEATYKEKFSSGKAGVTQAAWADIPTYSDALKKNFPDSKLVFTPALKGKDGTFGLRAASGTDRISYIPKAAEHPEDVMKWINAKLDKDIFKLMVIGEEGKHFTFKDGAYSPILPIFADERNSANNYPTGIDEKNYPTYWQARVRKDMRLFDCWDYLNNKLSADTKKIDVMGYAPYMPEYAKSNQMLTTMVNDYLVKVIVGGEPISGLDAFIQKWKTSGGDASTKEVNEWYATRSK